MNIPEAIKAPATAGSSTPIVKPKEERVKKVTGEYRCD